MDKEKLKELWEDANIMTENDFVDTHINYQLNSKRFEVAKQVIEEFLHDSYSDYPEHAGDVYIIRDKLYRWLDNLDNNCFFCSDPKCEGNECLEE